MEIEQLPLDVWDDRAQVTSKEKELKKPKL